MEYAPEEQGKSNVQLTASPDVDDLIFQDEGNWLTSDR